MKRLCLLLLLAAANFAHADEGEMRDRVREHVRTLRTAKLIEILDLDQAGAAKLFPVLNKYDDAIAAVMRDLGETRREMKHMIESGKADDAKLNKMIDQVLAGMDKRHRLEQERAKEVRTILPPTQVAKIVVALPRIERFINRELHEAMRRQHGGDWGPEAEE